MNFAEFKEFVIKLIREIAAIGDKKFADYKIERDDRETLLLAKAEEASQRADAAQKKVEELMAALVAKDQQLIVATSIATQELMADLNSFTSELVAEFKTTNVAENPTPVSDAVTSVIINEEAIDTSKVEELESVDLVNEPEPTPPAVLEAALEAVTESTEGV